MTSAQLAIVLVLGIAAYRITRFLVIDSLLEPGRTKLHSRLEAHHGIIWAKLYDLASCTWCVGVYVSMIVYAIYLWDPFIHWTRIDWLSAIAVSGVQGFLHSVEPEE